MPTSSSHPIQTLGRRAQHLSSFAPDAFDYVVVDEFHHAAAATYRKLISYFQPKFLSGLPRRRNGPTAATCSALCQENLVYRCDLVEGIAADCSVPFHYFGVPDEVDYANIPWRSTPLRRRGADRGGRDRRRGPRTHSSNTASTAASATLGFLRLAATRRLHGATSSSDAALRAVAVHAGPPRAPRAASLEALDDGELDVLFAVDMFNEGVDLPTSTRC